MPPPGRKSLSALDDRRAEELRRDVLAYADSRLPPVPVLVPARASSVSPYRPLVAAPRQSPQPQQAQKARQAHQAQHSQQKPRPVSGILREPSRAVT
jgi:hypothetical protein